ncbi:MAG: hypothetical protein LRZ84_23095 [Desertifilum sp.]|nr:hypothetical protein [Desertifilum sp.]
MGKIGTTRISHGCRWQIGQEKAQCDRLNAPICRCNGSTALNGNRTLG